MKKQKKKRVRRDKKKKPFSRQFLVKRHKKEFNLHRCWTSRVQKAKQTPMTTALDVHVVV